MIGVIGTGHMGAPIARRLAAAGWPLAVHDLRSAAMAPFTAVYGSPSALAAECSAILLSLPDHRAVAAVAEEVLPGLGGGLLVNLSTGAPAFLGPLAKAAADAGVDYVTAPVSQGADGAERGELTAFCAGEPDATARARPLLSAFCTRIIELPGHEAAMAAKIATNQAWFIMAAGLGEVLVSAVAAGVPAGLLPEILAASCGDSWAGRHDVPTLLAGGYDDTFTLRLCQKDLRLALGMARDGGVPSLMTGAASALFRRAAERYGQDAAELSVVRLAEEEAGIILAGVSPGEVPVDEEAQQGVGRDGRRDQDGGGGQVTQQAAHRQRLPWASGANTAASLLPSARSVVTLAYGRPSSPRRRISPPR